MVTEDYVSFETAKLLKEKGFDDIDCECYGWIGRSGKHYSVDDTFYDDEELKMAQEDRKDFVPLITLQMAMKWLRNIHNMYIEVCTDKTHNFKDIIFRPAIYDRELDCLWESDNFPTYEEACEEAIKYCIENLI